MTKNRAIARAACAPAIVRTTAFWRGTLDGELLVLVLSAGKLCALAGTCTHLGAPMAKAVLVEGQLRCPWHHARFDIYTGEAVAALAFETLQRYEISEADGFIKVGKPLEIVAPITQRYRPEGKIMIVGAGAAGHACAELQAPRGLGTQVILIGNESAMPYDRTFCSKQYLAGKKTRADAALPELESAGVSLRREATVIKLDFDGNEVVLADDQRVKYSTLVLATGAQPRLAKFDGADAPNVFFCVRSPMQMP